MNPTITKVLLYSILIILIALAGASILIVSAWQRRTIRLFISFGAGVLLGAAFLHMIPEAAHLIQGSVGPPMLLGFLSLFIFEKFIMVHACEAEDCDFHTVGLSALIGLSLHSMVTGIALGASLIAPQLSLVVFIAVALHKFPESFSLASILAHENYSRGKIFLGVFWVAVMVPVGAILTLLVLGSVSDFTVGWLVAFSAGTFLHIAADDLLPEVHTSTLDRKSSLGIFLAGIVLMWISQNVVA
ncbi:MAG: ZIP family metal transporter [candidate division KSB1 bacterium]|nr:ZIP family metal transporter [candidate division KSB1 bacterium]MDQ7062924.1 ZIP family metal transporter [candidate division KSB1 bacterium]